MSQENMKKLAVGVDIGGTNTVIGLVDSEANMYGVRSLLTAKQTDIDQYVEQIHSGIKQLCDNLEFEYQLVGVGIGAPNGNHFKGTIEYAANLIWKGVVPIVDKFRKYYPHIPIEITNDANAAAIGEMIYGGARGMKDFVVVTLGTGVGSGFVVNGQVMYGHDSFAGELGHVVVDATANGRMCGCGRRGCLETYASAGGVKRTAFELLATQTDDSELRNVPFNELTAKMITEAADNNDQLALDTFDYTGKVLGLALANMVAITSPEAIFLCGGLSMAGGYLFDPVKRYMEMNMLTVFRNKVKLLPSAFNDKSSAILGASALVWDAQKSFL